MMIIEKTIQDYLIGNLSQSVYCEVPLEPPAEYYLIERTGGGEADQVGHAVVAIKSVSRASLYGAMAMDDSLCKCMRFLADDVPDVFGCYLNSHYNFTNTQTKEYRYQAVFNINYQ